MDSDMVFFFSSNQFNNTLVVPQNSIMMGSGKKVSRTWQHEIYIMQVHRVRGRSVGLERKKTCSLKVQQKLCWLSSHVFAPEHLKHFHVGGSHSFTWYWILYSKKNPFLLVVFFVFGVGWLVGLLRFRSDSAYEFRFNTFTWPQCITRYCLNFMFASSLFTPNLKQNDAWRASMESTNEGK